MKRTLHTAMWIAALLLQGAVMGQSSSLRLGNEEFKQLNYNKAILAYEAASDKNLKAYRNLAQCYMIIGKWDKARVCLEHVCESDQPQINDFWNLAQVLTRMEDWEGAHEVMLSFCAKAPRDIRARTYRDIGDIEKFRERFNPDIEVGYCDFNSEENDYGVALHNESLVFASTRRGFSLITREWNGNQTRFSKIYVVNPDEPGDHPRRCLKRANGIYHTGPVAFNGIGNYCAITKNLIEKSDANELRNFGLFFSNFTGTRWSELIAFPYNNRSYSVGQATLDSTGNVMYFVSDMPGGLGGTDIWRSERRNGKWLKPKPVPSLNSEGNEMFPYYLPELGIMLFATDGRPGYGGLDIFAAKQRGDAFVKIRNLGQPVNSSSDDFSITMDAAMRTGYFCSNRAVPDEIRRDRDWGDTLLPDFDDDIYWVNLNAPFSFGKTISGMVVNDDGQPIDSAIISLLRNGEFVKGTTSSATGQFEFSVDSTGHYSIAGSRDFHFESSTPLEITRDVDDYSVRVKMNRDPKISVRVLVTDSEIGAPMEGVDILVIDLLSGDTLRHRTGENGEFSLSLPQKTLKDSIAYRFRLSMDGHITKTLTYRSKLDHTGVYDLHKAKVHGRSLDFSMRRKMPGDDLALQLGLLPYFFEADRNAPAIKKVLPDTTGDLAMLIQAMNDNPTLKVQIVTHTDCEGAGDANLKLSEQRAQALVAYLAAKVIDGKARISGRGEGERISKSGCNCEGRAGMTCTPEERQIDRRTEVIIKEI